MSKPVLVTRLEDSELKQAHVYRHDDTTWVFVSHNDPGYDYVVLPNGTTSETYLHDGAVPSDVPTILWEQYVTDITEGWYGEADDNRHQ